MSGPRLDPARPLRVLHVVRRLHYGGLERLVSEMLRRADRGAFDNHVLTLIPPGRFGDGLGAFATLHQAPPLSKASNLWPSALAREIRAIRPDIVHTHSGVWHKASVAARIAGVPVVVHTEHGRAVPDPWIVRKMDWLASRYTDVVIAVSEAVASHLKKRVVCYPDRVVVIPNGVDTAEFAPTPDDGRLRTELGVSPDTPIIGSIGRFMAVKGYEVAIHAYGLLRREWAGGAPPLLVLAGDGPERGRLEALARQLRVEGGVRFLGFRDDLARLLAAFTIFTMSSHSEGTSVSLLEAMSAGSCPVVTNVGGNAAVLGPALAHRLVPAADPAALARAWVDALADQARRRIDAAAARERVLREYTIEGTMQAYSSVYGMAMARRRVGRSDRVKAAVPSGRGPEA